ncbi:Uncharacterised protein [Bacillus freudenreichii]|nr:Uncharacterised protein [Bacillus freudenreichii]
MNRTFFYELSVCRANQALVTVFPLSRRSRSNLHVANRALPLFIVQLQAAGALGRFSQAGEVKERFHLACPPALVAPNRPPSAFLLSSFGAYRLADFTPLGAPRHCLFRKLCYLVAKLLEVYSRKIHTMLLKSVAFLR